MYSLFQRMPHFLKSLGMKKNTIKLIVILSLVFSKSYSQENQKIDSLRREVLRLERQVIEIKEKIKSEMLRNGYIIKVIGNKETSSIALQDERSRKVVGIIPKGSKVKIIDKISNFYKVQYNELEGLINLNNLKVDSTSAMDLLYPRTSEIKTSSFIPYKSRYKKSLNYSKPIKVRGHYRRTKSGKRVWVRPHTRKN